MPYLPDAIRRGLSRHTIALVVGIVLVTAGGMAGYAATGGFVPADDGTASSSGGVLVPEASASTAVAQGDAGAAEPATDPTPSPTRAPFPPADLVTISRGLVPGGAGGNQAVNVHNEDDGQFRIKGSIQLNTITAPNIAPQNSARAWSSCVDCQTLALAMQINLIDDDARRVAPQNLALAINYECLRCATIAIALQFIYTVDDPRETPPEVEQLIREMDKELRRAARERDDLATAVAGIDAVLARFTTLVASLDDVRDEATEEMTPGAVDETPPPSATPSASATPDASPSPTPTATPAPVATPEPSPAPSPTDAASAPP
jgi:putative peptide zinc metalloprotease protein